MHRRLAPALLLLVGLASCQGPRAAPVVAPAAPLPATPRPAPLPPVAPASLDNATAVLSLQLTLLRLRVALRAQPGDADLVRCEGPDEERCKLNAWVLFARDAVQSATLYCEGVGAVAAAARAFEAPNPLRLVDPSDSPGRRSRARAVAAAVPLPELTAAADRTCATAAAVLDACAVQQAGYGPLAAALRTRSEEALRALTWPGRP